MITVWLVDGNYIRTNVYPDFTEGGHDLVYNWVPLDAVYIDDDVLPEERPYIIFHELYERGLMAQGMKYPQAHRQASWEEWDLRQHPDKLSEYGLSGLDAVESLSAVEEVMSLRAAPLEQEEALSVALVALVTRYYHDGDLDSFEESFKRRLREALMAIALLFLMDHVIAQQMVEEEMAFQEAYLSQFARDLKSISEAQAKARAEMYAASVGKFYQEIALRHMGEAKLQWQYNPEAAHCTDCIELDGQTRKASEWYKLGLYPRSGQTKCLMNCQCTLLEV